MAGNSMEVCQEYAEEGGRPGILVLCCGVGVVANSSEVGLSSVPPTTTSLVCAPQVKESSGQSLLRLSLTSP